MSQYKGRRLGRTYEAFQNHWFEFKRVDLAAIYSFDDEGGEHFINDDRPVACKFCGEEDLYWMEVWPTNGPSYVALVNRRHRRHTCKQVDPKVADDFTVVPEE